MYKSYRPVGLFLLLLLTLPLLASEHQKNTSKLHLKIAAYKFERTEALFEGKVKIVGCDATFEEVGIGDLNTEAFSGGQQYDVTEIGINPFLIAYANEDFRDYTLLPVFLLRAFRQKSIFIATDKNINRPSDLKGKTIATPGYSSSSLTWIRGILQDEYGVSPQDVKWITSAKDSSAGVAGKISRQEQMLPKGISIKTGTKGKDESELLLSGEADALFHAAEPKAFIDGDPRIGRLFPDFKRVEQAYYKKMGIFPIMHVVAVRTSLLKKNPWLAKAVFDAFSKSKQLAYAKMIKTGWADSSLPWYAKELDETRRLMGNNFYSYGFTDNNMKTLKTLLRYSFEQGLTRKRLQIGELFAPQSMQFMEKN